MANSDQIPRRLSVILDKLKDHLGDADFRRLQAILPLFRDGPASFVKCLEELYAGKSQEDAQTAFRKFRQKVNDAGEEHGLALECDTKLKSPPEDRTCWWVGDDAKLLEELLAYGKAAISDTAQLTEFIRPLALPRSGASLAAGSNRTRVFVFVSYAHADGMDVQDLLEELKRQTGPSETYEIRYIADHAAIADDEGLPAGQPWHSWIQKAIATCDFGLLLISPAFLGSKYITRHELPPFRDGKKPMIPVVLDRVNFSVHNLNGLKPQQLFYLQPNPADLQLSYIECEQRNQRRNFAQTLHTTIEARLKELKPHGEVDIESLMEEFLADMPPDEMTRERIIEELGRHLAPGELAEFIRTFAKTISLRSDLQSLTAAKVDSTDAIDALKCLEAWACNPDAAPFFAVLGEYGIGKTTTLKELTRILQEKHARDSAIPVPIFIDLRNVIVPSDADAVPTLDEVLTYALRDWKVGNTKISLKPVDIIEAVQRHGTLIIFDGLDEVIVHLTPDRARRFIRELWRTLPPRDLKERDREARPGKLIVSCRSHYFKDVWTQNSMFTGEGREGIKADDYSACILLPFTNQQIGDYLALTHGKTKVAGILELFRSIHNLTELAQRPYLLSEMSSLVGELEEKKALGDPVLGVTLYELIVRKWLNRDDGKHHFSETDKRRMMEELAADMYRSGRREWEWSKVEQWLTDFLYRQPALADAYRGTKKEILNEDLRTATFILRPDDKQQHFRFAHTSLQEFFLASYLARALHDWRAGRHKVPEVVECWDMPMPSLETLEFLGQLLALAPSPDDLQALNAILSSPSPRGGASGAGELRAALVALRYWLIALEKHLPTPTPTHVNLAGAQLDEWKIRGPLNLRGANLAGARLNRARVENVDLTGADLTGLEARQSLFLNVQAAGAMAARVDFSGLQWRGGSLARADLSEARVACHWIDVDLSKTILPEGWKREACSARVAQPQEKMQLVDLQIQIGHSNWVSACAFSRDGSRLVSGSDDQTMKVWDASSGACLLTLKGHEGWVRSCAFSPDGARLVSGSEDKTLKLWDAATGRCLLTLVADGKEALCCVFSPDGTRLVSSSRGQTIHVWDPATGTCLMTLKGHQDMVRSCVFSPDGTRLVSCSQDSTLKVWDADSGVCLLTLKGHERAVHSCAFTPDGAQLISISLDQTLKVWDAAAGTCLLTLKRPDDSGWPCAFSPDGTRWVSASPNNTLKVWDVASGVCLLTLTGHEKFACSCAFSPDGMRLVTGSQDHTVKVWDAASGVCLLTLRGHESIVISCDFVPDGTRLICRYTDRAVQELDSNTGEFLRTRNDQEKGTLNDARPVGTRRVSASRDGIVRVLDTSTGECLWTTYVLPDLQTATMDGAGRITHASPEAWRFLGWRWFDPDLGRHRLLPAETFGPLPMREQVVKEGA